MYMKRCAPRKIGVSLALAAAALGTALPAMAAETNPFDGNWHYNVTPYLWLPNINLKLNYDIPPRLDNELHTLVNQFQTRIGPNDWLSDLKFAILLAGEVRKGNWSAFTDLIYLDLGNQDTRVRDITGPRGRELAQIGVQTTTNLSSTVWTLAGAYTVFHDPNWNLDLLLGFRYLGLDTELKWRFEDTTKLPALNLDRAGRITNNRELWDGIIGVKGQVRFGKTDWFMPYYLDVGAGDSDLTWQALLGVGYRYGWGAVTLSIRSLSYEFNEQKTDLRLTGPALGVSFRW
jgi:hypothetical protein